MQKSWCLIIVILTVPFLMPSNSYAATINAQSCSQAHVQAAIDSAADGDTVLVPAGECTWSTALPQKPSVLISNKNITLRASNTTITDSTGIDWKESALWIEGQPIRITGFTFIDGIPDPNNGLVHMEGTGADGALGFRIDTNRFLVDGGYAIVTRSLAYGLIDHNTFTTEADHTFIAVLGDGNASWSRPSSLGTAEAVYIEDNAFTNSGQSAEHRAVFAQRGGRFVFRHNNVTNLGIDAHGYCGDTSAFSYEVYGNHFVLESGVSMFRWMFIRGGSGVIFNNSLNSNGQLTRHIDMTEYRLSGINSCSGLQRSCCTEYPCTQQVGRGTDQALESAHYWDNTVNSAPAMVSVNQVDDGTCTGAPDINDYIILNRDYYLTEKPGYAPLAYPHPLSGIYLTNDCSSVADTDCDGCLAITELMQYINQWKATSQVTISQLMQAIGLWKTIC
jgi:hypothetical protein